MNKTTSIVDALLCATETADAEIKWFPNEFAYKKVTADSYRCYTDNNGFYVLYSSCDYDDSWDNHSDWVSCKDNTLLKALLHLREEIGTDFFEALQKSNYLAGVPKKILHSSEENVTRGKRAFHYESRISAPILEAVKRICKEFGYPFAITECRRKSGVKVFPKLEAIKPDRYIGFNVLAFLYELDELYGATHLVNKVLSNNETYTDYDLKVSKVTPSRKSSLSIRTFTDNEITDLINQYTSKFDILSMSEKDKEELEELKGKLRSAHTNHDRPNARIEFDSLNTMSKQECIESFINKFKQRHYEYSFEYDGGVFIEIRTKNLFDAAFYQLAQMLILPGRQVKICPICKNFFIPEDPRQKYCKTLNRRTGKYTCYPAKMYKRKNYIRKIADE